MSPEKPTSDNDVIARLKQIEERQRNQERVPTREFETENGFQVSVQFFPDDLSNVTLRHAGLTSHFSIQAERLQFMELRGPDDEHVTNPDIIARHGQEAKRLYDAGAFAPDAKTDHQTESDN
jgi:uncharacterized protein YkuJ